jgi:hypothetical protein
MKAIAVRKRLRQVQHNATHRDHHLSAQFQEMIAQGRDLRPGVVSPCQAKPHLLHQHIRCPVSSTRNVFAKKFEQLVRPICMPPATLLF